MRIDANAQAGLQPKNTDGCTVFTVYDELNRPVQSKDALGGITKMRYDLLGNVTQITDAANKLTQNTYDDLGRLISVSDPLIETPTDKIDSYTYDEAGNALTYTNRLGQVSRSTYDSLNRLTKTEYLTDATSDNIVYDSFGDATSISNNGVTYTMTYDVQHRMDSKTDSRQNKSLFFGYDPVDNLLLKQDYQGSITEYRYDSANQLVSLTNPTYLSANYQHDAAGRLLTRTLSSGAQTNTTYDANGWPVSLTQKSANGTVLSSTTYTRDRLGNILSQVDTVGSTTGSTIYTYDALYRLITADYPAIGTGSATVNDEAFTYDPVGNRLTQTKGGLSIGAAGSTTRYYQYTANSNRLSAVRLGSLTGTIEKAYTYDDTGRMTAQAGTGAKTLTWNQQDRARTINANSRAITYSYDPLSYRIASSGSSRGSQDYYLEGEHLEALYSNNLLQAQYLRGVSTDELLAGWLQDTGNPANVPANANAGVSANTITGTPYIFHHDSQNSVSAISSHDGNMLQQASYSAFGNSLSQTGSAANNSNTNTLKYTGREQDADTGLYYYRARYYDTDIGRFISEDPLGFQAGINFYAYVDNNPVNANDPSGMCPSCVGALTSVALGGAIRYATSGGDWNAVFDGGAITLDAGLGAVGAGLANKLSTINQLSKIEKLAVPGNRLGQIGESLAGISATGKTAIPSISGTATRRFPDLNLGNITEIKNVSKISPRDAAQIYDSILFDQARGATTSLLTRGSSTNISLVQNFVDNGLLNIGKIPGINSSGVANISNGAASSIGFSFGAINYLSSSSSAAGGYLIYPNKPNNNQMQSVYSK